jgi:2-iminobutanoate/2-iminopropanoate deaminase
MNKQCISSIPGGAPAIGPYSPAVIAEGKFVFVSGQIPYDPVAGGIVRGTVAEQTRLVLENMRRALEAAGATLDDVVSCRVYLQPLSDESFSAMNRIYEVYFGTSKPARATLGAQLLNFDVEIEAVAVIE